MLEDCWDAGYKEVWIGGSPYSKVLVGRGHIIAAPAVDGDDGWPAIWRIAEKYFGSGCGNGLGPKADQKQVYIDFPKSLEGKHVNPR